MNKIQHPVVTFIVYACIAAALTFTAALRVADCAVNQEGTGTKAWHAGIGTRAEYMTMLWGPAWQTRWASVLTGGLFMGKPITDARGEGVRLVPSTIKAQDVLATYNGRQYVLKAEMQNGVFWWATTWMGITFGLCWFFRRRRMLMALGTYAALQFAWLTSLGHLVFPWDLPALAFFTAVCLAVHRQWWWLLVTAVVVGTPFKETALVGCLGGLAMPGRLSRRIAGVVVLGAVAGGLKILADAYMGLEKVGATGMAEHYLKQNWEYIWTASWRHPLLANAGMLAPAVLVGLLNRRWTLMLILGVFLGGIWVCGNLQEIRILFEAIPMGLLLLFEYRGRDMEVIGALPGDSEYVR